MNIFDKKGLFLHQVFLICFVFCFYQNIGFLYKQSLYKFEHLAQILISVIFILYIYLTGTDW